MKRQPITRIRPPRPPKSQMQKVHEVALRIQDKAGIESCANTKAMFDKINFKSLEVVKEHEKMGPGKY